MLFGINFDDSEPWKHLPTELVPRALLPHELAEHGAAWRVVGQPRSMVAAAVFNGTWIHGNDLKEMVHVLGLPLPEKGAGCGHGGSLTKMDRAKALVAHVCQGKTVSDEEQARMIASIMYKHKKQLKETEVAVLEILQHLDPEELHDSSVPKLQKIARETLYNRLRTEGRKQREREAAQEETAPERKRKEPSVPASSSAAPQDSVPPAARKPRTEESAPRAPARVGVTPPTLRSFLPPGCASEVSLLRDPDSYGYRATFPHCALDALIHMRGRVLWPTLQ